MKNLKVSLVLCAVVMAASFSSGATRSVDASGSNIIAGVIANTGTLVTAGNYNWISVLDPDNNWASSSSPAYLDAGGALTAGSTNGSVSVGTEYGGYDLYDASIRAYVAGSGYGYSSVDAHFDTDGSSKTINIWGPTLWNYGVAGITDFYWEIWDSNGNHASGYGETSGITGFSGYIHVQITPDDDYGYFDSGDAFVQVEG